MTFAGRCYGYSCLYAYSVVVVRDHRRLCLRLHARHSRVGRVGVPSALRRTRRRRRRTIQFDGEAGTRKIGLRSNAWIRTSQYARIPRRGRLFDELLHLAATGTENVWVIDYRFSVAGHSAFGRSYVAQSFWSDVRAGSTVRVMYVPDDPGNNRLAESGRLRDVIVMALLALLCLGLAYAPQWLRDRKRNS